MCLGSTRFVKPLHRISTLGDQTCALSPFEMSHIPPASYLGVWTGYTEAMVYFIVAIVVVTAAYHAVVEVR